MQNAIWINEYFRLALEASPSGQLIVDECGLIKHINSKISDMFGYEHDELINERLEILVPEEYRGDHPGFRKNFFTNPVVRAMGSGQVLFGLKKNGTRIPVEIGLNPLADSGKKYVLASIVDVSERHHAHKLFQIALDASPSGLMLVDASGKVVLVNSKIEEIFGYSRDELLNQSIGMLLPNDYRDRHPAFINQYMQNPSVRSMGTGRDLYGLRKDGSEVPVEIGLNPLEIEGKAHALASVVDITERKRAEEEKQSLNNQIQHAQRLESLGVLAGGTAHDFNNILYAISGNAELALMNLSTNKDISRFLNNIVDSCMRAADLTKQMLAYAGKANLVYEKVLLNDLINNMLDLLTSTLPKTIVINKQMSADIPLIEADASQIQQIIMNLITNAREAIGDNFGDIVIRTGYAREDHTSLQSYRHFDYLEAGEYVYLEVEDSGAGMAEEVVENMFDPFFTTKFTGRGLGMAAVLGIIRSHHGSVRVSSEPGKGTVIRVILPVNKTNNLAEDVAADTAPGSYRALVIDDEHDIREILEQVLVANNFDVVTASSGTQALELIQTSQHDFDLVTLDLNMPGMTGKEVYNEICKQDSLSKIIMITGYSEEEISALMPSTENGHTPGIDALLQKPFRTERLVAILKSLFEH